MTHPAQSGASDRSARCKLLLLRPLLAVIFGWSVFNTHASGPALLLLPFDNATGARQFDALAGGMPDLLTACFSHYPDQLVVIDRSALSRAMNEVGLSVEAYVDPAERQRAGAIVGADFVVRGSFTMINGELKLEVLTFSVTDATLVAAIAATLSGEAIIEQVCRELAAPMVATLARLPAQAKPSAVDDPVEQALMMEGLSHYYTNDFVAAIAPFLKLVRLAPENESAHYWLGKSFAGAKLDKFAAIQLNAYLAAFPTSHRSAEVESIAKSLTPKR